jgi:hypothetical protein
MEVNAVSIMSLCLTTHLDARPQLVDIIAALENAKLGKHVQMLNTDTSMFDTRLPKGSTDTTSHKAKANSKSNPGNTGPVVAAMSDNTFSPPPAPTRVSEDGVSANISHAVSASTNNVNRGSATGSSLMGRRSLSMRQSADSMDEFGDFEGPVTAPETSSAMEEVTDGVYDHSNVTLTNSSIVLVDALLLSDELIRMTEAQLSRGTKMVFESMIAIRCKSGGIGSETTDRISGHLDILKVFCVLLPFGLVIRESADNDSKVYSDIDFNKYCLHRNSRLQAVKLTNAVASTTPLGEFVVSIDSFSISTSTSIAVLQFGCESSSEADAWVARLNVVFKSILI